MTDLRRPLPRLLTAAVAASLDRSPVVVLTGARQTGKSTLCRDLLDAAGRETITFDDLREIELARREPRALLARADRLTLDEVQRVPQLLLAIKADVDRRRRKGRFLLTGSANLLLMRRVSESLAGRAVFLHLGGLTGGELRRRPDPGPWSAWLHARDARGLCEAVPARRVEPIDWCGPAWRGGLPPAALAQDDRERAQWQDGYVTSYLERDVRELSSVSRLPDFRRLMVAAAERIGERTNQAQISLEAGVSNATGHRYLNLLETTYQIRRVPPFTASRSERLVKTPRLFFEDTGIAARLLGLDGPDEVRDHRRADGFLENHLLLHLRAWRDAEQPTAQILYWRTALARRAVSFVIERGRTLLGVDVRRTTDPSVDDAASLEAFLDDQRDRARAGVLLHEGAEVLPLTARVAAVPLGAVL